MGHEIAEQDREKNQAQHLTVGCRLNDIGRNHSHEDIGYITDASVADLCHHFIDRGGEGQGILRRLAVNITGLNRVDNEQADQDRHVADAVLEQRVAERKAGYAVDRIEPDEGDEQADPARYRDAFGRMLEKKGLLGECLAANS